MLLVPLTCLRPSVVVIEYRLNHPDFTRPHPCVFRNNGYFIYSTIEGVSFQPRDVPIGPVFHKLGDGAVIPGLEEVMIGMKPGGKRRALVPPEVGYTDPGLEPQPPTFATKRQLMVHSKEALLFEVEVLKINGPRSQ